MDDRSHHTVGRRACQLLVISLLFPVAAWARPGARTPSAVRSETRSSRETRSLESKNMHLSVSLEETSGGARFVLDSISDPVTGAELDTSASPIWQVMLADRATPPPGVAFPPDDELTNGSVVVSPGQAEWGPAEPGALVLRWTGLEVPGGQTLDVEVSIHMRSSDGFAVWSMSARLSEGSYMLVSSAFPVLDLPGIGEDSSDDVLFHPSMGGSVISDPVGCGRSLAEFSNPTNDPDVVLLYPSDVTSQFMSLYDHDLGLYLAAEDPGGALKGLVYSTSGQAMRLWFRNYNTTPYDDDRAAMAAALRTLDLEDLGYPVVTGLHHGDWMDAADVYRKWVLGANTPILANGLLTSRQDIGKQVRNAVLNIRYSFGFYDSSPVDLEEDEKRLGSVLDFFRANDPGLSIAVSLVGVIAGREDADIPRESWYGSTGRPELDGDLKPGVSEIIDWLDHTYGIPAGHNRDTEHWRLEESTTERQLYDTEDALHRAIVRRWDGTPRADHWRLTQLTICEGSQWQMARRKAIRTATVMDSRGADGTGTGFRFLLITGGQHVNPCYAPLLADNAGEDHHHPVGGGSWWMERFHSYAASLRSLYGDDAPFYTLIPEREHEQLIGVPGLGILGGKGRWYPFSDDTVTQPGGGSLPCSQPVPLSMYLYHQWVLQGVQGTYFSDFVDAFGAAYGENGLLDPHPNFQVAVAALTGRILPLKLRGYNLAAHEDPAVDGPFFDQLGRRARENRELLRLLAETRAHNLEHLAWGRMLRFPTVATDVIQLEAHRDGQLRSYPIKAVLASAFRAADGTVKLFVANPTRQSRTCTLSFDSAGYGIETGSTWRLDRLDPSGHATFAGWVRGGTIYTSPEISMGPLSVQVFSLRPAAPRGPARPTRRVRPSTSG